MSQVFCSLSNNIFYLIFALSLCLHFFILECWFRVVVSDSYINYKLIFPISSRSALPNFLSTLYYFYRLTPRDILLSTDIYLPVYHFKRKKDIRKEINNNKSNMNNMSLWTCMFTYIHYRDIPIIFKVVFLSFCFFILLLSIFIATLLPIILPIFSFCRSTIISKSFPVLLLKMSFFEVNVKVSHHPN